MSGGIFFIQENHHLVEMIEKPYDTQTLLQDLLERYPHLLAVTASPQSWLMIKRDQDTLSDEGDDHQWLWEHLFLDPQGIPTLVDIQQGEETTPDQVRLGEMIDYATHVRCYWSEETLITAFERNCHQANKDPEQVLETFLGEGFAEEQFWQQVKTNLQAGKMRLIFVGDRIGERLQRMIEFLNKQMDPAEVLGLEIKQYVTESESFKTLVSKVVGQTAETQQKTPNSGREQRQWHWQSFLGEYQTRHGEEEAQILEALYDWIQNQGEQVVMDWNKGSFYGGVTVSCHTSCYSQGQGLHELFFLGIDGTLQIASENYGQLPIFNQEEGWKELRHQLSAIGLALPPHWHDKRFPSIFLSTLSGNHEALEQMLTTFDWVLNQV